VAKANETTSGTTPPQAPETRRPGEAPAAAPAVGGAAAVPEAPASERQAPEAPDAPDRGDAAPAGPPDRRRPGRSKPPEEAAAPLTAPLVLEAAGGAGTAAAAAASTAAADKAAEMAMAPAARTPAKTGARKGEGARAAEPARPGEPSRPAAKGTRLPPQAERPAEPPPERLAERPPERPAEPPPERLAERAADRPAEPPAPSSSGSLAGSPGEPAAAGPGGGFVAGLLGGAVAIAAGVGALWLTNPDLLRGAAPAPDLSPIEARLDAQDAGAAALTEEVARLAAAVEAEPTTPAVDTAGLEERIAAVEGDVRSQVDALTAEVARLSEALSVLEGRVGQVEVRPPVMEGDAAAATAEVVAEMRAALDAQRAEIEALVGETRQRIAAAEAETKALQDGAEAAAKAAVARAATSRLAAALEGGGPFVAALDDLSQAGGVAVPAELTALAATGVPTLADLSGAFPEPARAALAASIREGVAPDAGAMARIGAFLRAQTGARSTAPREGEDPDAVLSRAEAALAEGRLADAVALIALLPAPGQAAMADWVAMAQARLTAVSAADALRAAMPAN
jgi:hypothetical protein